MVKMKVNFNVAAQHSYMEELFDYVGDWAFDKPLPLWTPVGGTMLLLPLYSDEEHNTKEKP